MTAEHSIPEIIAEVHRKAIVDLEAGTLRRCKAYKKHPAGSLMGVLGSRGYFQMRVFNKMELNHRLIWLLAHGCWPTDQLDHINRDRKDNRLCNLREVTNTQNQQNKSKQGNNTSGHPGVTWHNAHQKWQARIQVDGKRIHLGYFDTFEEAVAARKAGELKFFTHAPK